MTNAKRNVKWLWCLVSILGLVLLLGGESLGEELSDTAGDDLSYGLDAALNTKYIWRGINLDDEPVFQPDIWVACRGFTVSIWGNMELSDYGEELEYGNQSGKFTELDYTMDYSGSWEKWGYSVGIIHYDFPHTGAPNTTEVYAGLGADVPLQPTVTLYGDVDEADGLYGTISVSHSLALPDRIPPTSMSLDTSVTVGWATDHFNDYYFGVDETAFTDVLVTAALAMSVGDNLVVTPALNYSSVLDDTLRDSLGENEDNFWAGITLALSF